MLIKRVPRRFQPQTYADVDRSNPLTLGLVSVDSPGATVLAQKVGASEIQARTPGLAYVGNGSSTGFQRLIGTQPFDSTRATVLALVMGAPTAADRRSYAVATSTGFILQIGTGKTTSSKLRLWYRTPSLEVGDADSNAVVFEAGVPHLAVLRYQSGSLDAFVDGVYDSSVAGTAGGSSSGSLWVGINGLYRGSLSNANAAPVILGAAWNRALQDSEIVEISRNPWQLFTPRSIWVPVSVGGGGTDLTIQDATHGHTANGPTITVASTFAIQDATHAHAADSLTLTLDTTLAIADALHAHTADNLTLSVSGATDLVIQDALHGHTADSLALTLGYVDLAIADALHGHAADNITLGGLYTDLELILKILSNRQELNAGTGTFTIYDDDSVSVLFTASAWADAAGTVPYSGGTLGRIDALA